ncbi:hypothetical protein EJ110_NYTH15891 [Nymphaea thermarum]|nr:hypothetical protein EJ110_NYTH15891 [Nymphaea thermarum]
MRGKGEAEEGGCRRRGRREKKREKRGKGEEGEGEAEGRREGRERAVPIPIPVSSPLTVTGPPSLPNHRRRSTVASELQSPLLYRQTQKLEFLLNLKLECILPRQYDLARALEKWGGLQEVSRLLSLKLRHPRGRTREEDSNSYWRISG